MTIFNPIRAVSVRFSNAACGLPTIDPISPAIASCQYKKVNLAMRFAFRNTVSVMSLAFAAAVAHADNWPQWRGPAGTGVAQPGDYPVEFSDTENVAWTVELPGRGSSTPVVWGDNIFVTGDIDGQDGVMCYTRDGQERWTKQLGPGRGPRNRVASGSNPSPATDGEHLIVYYKSGRLACLDFAGEEKWQHNLQEDYIRDTLQWDLGTSPVLVDGKAVIAVMHRRESYLVAYDIASGEVAWRVLRDYNVNAESNDSYTTPNVVSVNGQKQIVVWGADHLSGHDAATGEKLWEYRGFNPQNEGNWRVIASAAASDGVAVVPYGRAGLVAAVELGKNGDVTNSSDRLWQLQGRGVGSDVATPIIQGDRVYLLTDAHGVACYGLHSGDELWNDPLPRARAKYYASPVLAGDQIYCARDDGLVFVGKVSDDGFKLLAENKINEPITATPVPLDGGLLVRGEAHLFRIGE